MMDDKRQNFVNAFIHTGSTDAICDCGKHYYEEDYAASLDDVERVKIKIDDNSIEVWSVRIITLMGKDYVEACDCWKEPVDRVMAFVDSHKYEIADYLNTEKQRLIREANAEPTVSI